MIRALVFDLDDTLYCERDFVCSGFLAVAQRMAAVCGADCADIHDFMLAELSAAGRGQVLPAILRRFPDCGFELPDLVSIYRNHVPAIRLFDGCRDLLVRLRKSYRLGLLTDGNPQVQRAKCGALGLGDLFDQMIFTWDFGQEREKPHPFPFRLMLDRLAAAASQALFIGDNIEKDCRGARSVGMKSIRVRKQGTERFPECGEDADAVIDSLTQLPFILTLFGGQHEAA
jgi:putative hydrolase of the HAD superfamily